MLELIITENIKPCSFSAYAYALFFDKINNIQYIPQTLLEMISIEINNFQIFY